MRLRSSQLLLFAVLCSCGPERMHLEIASGAAFHPSLRLATEGSSERPAVADRDELLAAARQNQRALAGSVEPIAELTWRGRTFSHVDIGDALALRARQLFPGSTADINRHKRQFAARTGVELDNFWRVLLEGYKQQLADLYGVDADNAHVTRDRTRPGHALKLVMHGWLSEPDGSKAYEVEFSGGQLAVSGASPAPRAKPELPQSTDDQVVETVVVSRTGGHYDYASSGLGPVYLRATGDDATTESRFVGKLRRAYAEPARYVTRSGRRLSRVNAVTRWTPYYRLRPAADSPIGLTGRVHLVRATLDGSALPGSATLTETLTVLDGTDEVPFVLTDLHAAALARFNRQLRPAEPDLARQIGAIEAQFERDSRAWIQQTAGTDPAHIDRDVRNHSRITPVYQWDPGGGTMTITVLLERRYEIHYTRAGRAGEERATHLEQSYDFAAFASYTFDRHGTLIRESSLNTKLSSSPEVNIQQRAF